VDPNFVTDIVGFWLQAVGYLLVLGYGTIFTVLTIMITMFDKAFLGTKYDSEGFNTAGRSIKTGLVAVDVVSHWTW
jgi:Na+/proline symporter